MMKVSSNLEAIDAGSDPCRSMVPFPSRIRLTRDEYPTAVYAIGRTKGEIVVEIESHGEVHAHLLGSVINHSPGLYHALVEENLASLPNL